MKNKMVLVRYERDILNGEVIILSREELTEENIGTEDTSYSIRDGNVFVQGSLTLVYSGYNFLTEQYDSVTTLTEDSPYFNVELIFTRTDDAIILSVQHEGVEWLTAELPSDFDNLDEILDELDPCFIYDLTSTLESFRSAYED